MEVNRSLRRSTEEDDEMMMMMMRKGKHPFSLPPCSSSSSHHYHQYHDDRRHQQPPPRDEEEQGGGDVAVVTVEREHMFDKVVTPSDVGKLNRLVIPKQHAERYFPLDSAAQEKGLLLCFEDRSGKPWRFRYSYWNSSQSYVMTKGWSRFVKDKKLDAGDVVSFHRARDNKLFIDWRHRPDHPPHPSSFIYHHHQYLSPAPSNYSLFMPPPAPPILPRDSRLYWPNHPLGGGYYPNSSTNSVIYVRPAMAAGPQVVQWKHQHQHQQGGGGSSSSVMDPRVYESVPVVHAGKAAAAAHKRLRLFGVNMDILPNNNNITSLSPPDAPTTISFSAAAGGGGGRGRGVSTPAPADCNPHGGQYLYPSELALYNGTPRSSSSTSSSGLVNKGKSSSSSMSLDLEFSDDS